MMFIRAVGRKVTSRMLEIDLDRWTVTLMCRLGLEIEILQFHFTSKIFFKILAIILPWKHFIIHSLPELVAASLHVAPDDSVPPNLCIGLRYEEVYLILGDVGQPVVRSADVEVKVALLVSEGVIFDGVKWTRESGLAEN